MSEKKPIQIRLSLADDTLRRRVQAALADDGFQLLSETLGRPTDDTPSRNGVDAGIQAAATSESKKPPADIVIVAAGQLPRFEPRLALQIAQGATAIVALGDEGIEQALRAGSQPASPREVQAEVMLPADTSPRELALACRLLAQTVRLRRRLRVGRRQRDRLSRLAETDPLTGLPNRRAWERELHARLRLPARAGDEQCLAIVDLDHFKRINEGRGYATGDQVLAATAAALRRAVRADDFVARLGGDEFGVLLARVSGQRAAAILDRVRLCVTAEVRTAGEPVWVSIGYVLFAAQRGADAATLFEAADLALRAAKSLGRNRTAAAPSRPA